MSDTATPAAAEPTTPTTTSTDGGEDLRQIAADLQPQREAGKLRPPAAPEPDVDLRILNKDDGRSPVSSREAARLHAAEREVARRQAEQERVAAGWVDPWAQPAGAPGASAEQPVDPDLAAQSEAAQVETRRQHQLEQELVQGIAALGPAGQRLVRRIEQAHADLAAQFPTIKTAADLERLEASEPERFKAYQAASGRLEGDVERLGHAVQMEGDRRQFAAEREAHQNVVFLEGTELTLAHVIRQHAGPLFAAFPGARSLGDVERAVAQLAAQDPAQWGALKERVGQLREGERHLNGVAEQRKAVAQAQFEEWGRAEDAKFLDRNPDMRDFAKLREHWGEVYDYFAEHGFSPEQTKQFYNGDQNISGRNAVVRTILRENIEARKAKAVAQASIKNGKIAQLPPVVTRRSSASVQRPGVAQGNGDGDRIATLERKFASASGRKQLEIGAALLAARRERH